MTRPRLSLLGLIVLMMALVPASRSKGSDPIYPKPKVDLAFNRLSAEASAPPQR